MQGAALIKKARVAAGMSQAEFARRAGTSQPVISAYERGHRDPTVATLSRLIRAAGVELEVRARPVVSDLPPAVDDDERARRLVDVLLLAEAVPRRGQPRAFQAPRLASR